MITREEAQAELARRKALREQQALATQETPVQAQNSPSETLSPQSEGKGSDFGMGALAGPLGAPKSILGALAKVPSIQTGTDVGDFTGQLAQEAGNVFKGSESIRARAARLGGVGGVVGAGGQGLDALGEAGKGALGDLTRVALNTSEEEAQAMNLPKQDAFGDILRDSGAPEIVAKVGGLAAELLTDPLTYLGGEVVKKGISEATTKQAEKQALDASGEVIARKQLPDGSFIGKNPANVVREVVESAPESNTQLMLHPQRTIETNTALLEAKGEQLLKLNKLISKTTDPAQLKVLKDKTIQTITESEQLQKQLQLDNLSAQMGEAIANRRSPFVEGLQKRIQLVSTYLEKRGATGQKIATLMTRASRQGDQNTAKYLSRFEAQGKLDKVFNSLTPEQSDNFVKVLDGFDSPKSDVVDQLVKIHRANWAEIGDDAVRRGVMTDGKPFTRLQGKELPHQVLSSMDLIKNKAKVDKSLDYAVSVGKFDSKESAKAAFDAYADLVRRHVDDGITKIAVTEANTPFLQWLVKDGQAKNLNDAAKLVRRYMTKAKSPRFGSLEHARIMDFPFYNVDPIEVLTQYYKGAGERLAQYEMYGRDDQIMNTLIQQFGNELGGNEAEFVKKAFDLSTGAIKPSANFLSHEASAAIRNFEVLSKLGRAAVVNASQQKNTVALTGYLRTVKSIWKALANPADRAFAFRSGSVFNEFTDALYGISKGPMSKVASSVLDKTGFSYVEKMNRVTAAIAGRDFAKDLAKKVIANGDEVAKRMLKKMDLDVAKIIKNGGLDEQDMFDAANSMANRTQFRARVMDSPLWAQSAEGKVVNQFKNFAENEYKFIRKELLGEIKHNNWAPVMRYVSSGLVGGLFITETKEQISNALSRLMGIDPKPPTLADRNLGEKLVDAAASVGAFGMLYDVLQSFNYKGADALGSLVVGAGTVGGLVDGLVSSVADREEGQILNLKKLTKFAAGNVPILGPDLRRAFEDDSSVKRRYTEAFNAATEKGLPTKAIVKAAAEAGISIRELRAANRATLNRKRGEKRKKARETKGGLAEAFGL